MIVVDTNVVVHLITASPSFGERAAALLLEDPEWAAPPILLSELRNVLCGLVRADVIQEADAQEAYADASAILRGRVGAMDGALVIETALESGLSAYDAEFVVLARTLEVPLVTLDRAVLRAAPEVAREL